MKPVLTICKVTVTTFLLTILLVSCRAQNTFTDRWVEQKYGEEWYEFSETTFFVHTYNGEELTLPYTYTKEAIFVNGEESFKYKFINDNLAVFSLGDDFTFERVKE